MHQLITDLVSTIYGEPIRPAHIPGSLVGVPIVEAQAPGAVMVRADGSRVVLAPPER